MHRTTDLGAPDFLIIFLLLVPFCGSLNFHHYKSEVVIKGHAGAPLFDASHDDVADLIGR